MAKFLTTNGMSYELEELIKSARERLFLFSPYLKLNERLRSLLEDRARLKIDIRIIYGKNELQPEEQERLRQLQTLHLTFLKNLHAKCYLSEERAIIGSMNLYDFSQQNNEEMGVLVKKQDDPTLFAEIVEDAQRLLRTSEPVAITIEKIKPQKSESRPSTPRTKKISANGFCLRCGETIAFNPERPYCASDYKAWAKWQNADYEDPHCHSCGKEATATMSKPLCRDCYEAAPF